MDERVISADLLEREGRPGLRVRVTWAGDLPTPRILLAALKEAAQQHGFRPNGNIEWMSATQSGNRFERVVWYFTPTRKGCLPRSSATAYN